MFPNPMWPYLRLFDDDQRILGLDEAVQIALSGDMTYLLRDEFTTAQSAPLTSPRTCEPGPGTLTITDSANTLSITSEITPSAQSTGSRDPWIRETVGRARLAGRCFQMRCKRDSAFGANANDPVLGWINTLTTPSTSNLYGLLWGSGSGSVFIAETVGTGNALQETILDDTYCVLSFVMRGTGFLIFRDAALIWVGTVGTDTPLYPAIFANAAAHKQLHIDRLLMIDLLGAFASDYGIATLHQISGLTSGTNFIGDADGEHHLYFNLPGSPAANDVIELRFNVTDANNYNTLYVKRNAGNTAWDFNMDTVASGSSTNRINVTGVGSPTFMKVISNGSLRDCYTGAGTPLTLTKRGAQVNVSNQNTATLTNTTFTAGQFTPTALDSFPRTSSAYNVLSTI